MRTDAFAREVPVGGYAIPYQRERGGDVLLEVAVITPDEAREHESALADLTEVIGWSAPPGKSFPDGRLTVAGTRPSRAHVPELAARLGSRVAVCADPNASALVAAWEDFLARYREVTSSLAESSRGRRAQALDEAAAERDRYRAEMEAWAKVYGSGRLHHALKQGERPQRIYRAERRERELPGFHIDPDGSWRTEPLRDPSFEAIRALGAVEAHLAEWDIEHSGCELVFVPDDGEDEDANGRSAVCVTGWLGRHALFGFVPTNGRTGPITGEYPDGVRVSSGSVLRPTAYASAYGIKHPAAQEALRHAAIVVVDFFHDGEPKETLKEYLPPDAHDLIEDGLVDDVSDTLFLVGWKLGQPTRHELSSYAEQIAAHLILLEAQTALEIRGDSLNEAAYKEAETELLDAFEVILDPEWAYEDLPEMEHLSLEHLVPTGVPRRASLWAPWHPDAGDPAPRTTGDEEPSWTLTDEPGESPRAQTGAEIRWKETARREADLPDLFRATRWRAGQRAHLQGNGPGRTVLVLRIPERSSRRERRSMPWFLECFRDDEAARNGQSEWSHPLAWEKVFELLPSKFHPLATDAVFAEIADAKAWALELARRVLPGGALDSLQFSVRLLDGVEALREQLERCRRMGVIRDRRLTAEGLRHAAFGREDRMRFEATIRFVREDDQPFERIRANFGFAVEALASLPISLELEPHPSDDRSVHVRCGVATETVGEAFEVANEVISQLRWRLRLEPIDLDSGEEDDEVGYTIHQLVKDSDDPAA
ncbi:hypothetical protein [Conexibacter arvalis]|uniref:Uncharacterized protein n=1 Tax=Conexibacter arvalis TaxID=912552 RepID=A0A840IMK5_9ACTN|nr:hypothetical protein [Conexibacter arvalis]MBB4665090.1 hypothetical protein [Conexibacter arvalis]